MTTTGLTNVCSSIRRETYHWALNVFVVDRPAGARLLLPTGAPHRL